jgi:dephospho-CoA kinase
MTTSRTHIPLLGLTGGIGSGKSTALAYLHELGAATISSDDIVHGLYSTAEVIDLIREHYGEAVIDGAGGISRPALASIVFADEAELRWLEDLLHPFVRDAVARWMEEQQKNAQPRPALIVVEVPLLFETGFEQRFDFIMLITAPDDLRRRRLTAKLTDSEFRRRRAQQLPEEEKIARSDFVFDNTGSRKDLREFVGQTVARILAGERPAVGDGAGESAS